MTTVEIVAAIRKASKTCGKTQDQIIAETGMSYGLVKNLLCPGGPIRKWQVETLGKICGAVGLELVVEVLDKIEVRPAK